MKNFNSTAKGMWVATIVILIVVLIVAVWPKPSVNSTLSSLNNQKGQLMKQIESTNALIDSSNKMISERDWKTEIGVLSPRALSDVSNLAKSNGVSLTSFRPEKIQAVGNLSMVPFNATVQGSFPAINKFLDALYSKGHIAIIGYQINLSGQEGNICISNINLAAFTSKAQDTN